MSKLGIMRAENPLDIITASDEPKENPFEVEEDLEETEPWQDRPEYDENGLPNE